MALGEMRACDRCGKPYIRNFSRQKWCGDECRFWTKVQISDGCWEWGTSAKTRGYGVFMTSEGTILAHRQAYQFANGPITDGLWVLHRCDNPACCNPAHLFLGTHQDNMSDMTSKGRHWNLGKKVPEERIAKQRAKVIGKKLNISEDGMRRRVEALRRRWDAYRANAPPKS